MARGRMINTSISSSVQVKRLCRSVGESGALFWTWMIAHLDVDGRIVGDPDLLKAIVCPTCSGVTPDLVRKTLGVAHDLGLIQWYLDDGEMYVQYPGFERNQIGLRKEKEKQSQIPAPTGVNVTELLRSEDGVTTESVRTNDGMVTEKGRIRKEGRKLEGSKEWNEGMEVSTAVDPTTALQDTNSSFQKQRTTRAREEKNNNRITLSDFETCIANAGLQLVLSPTDRERFSKLQDPTLDEVRYAVSRAKKAKASSAGYVLEVIERERERALDLESKSETPRAKPKPKREKTQKEKDEDLLWTKINWKHYPDLVNQLSADEKFRAELGVTLDEVLRARESQEALS